MSSKKKEQDGQGDRTADKSRKIEKLDGWAMHFALNTKKTERMVGLSNNDARAVPECGRQAAPPRRS
jgi:hypothetical protein